MVVVDFIKQCICYMALPNHFVKDGWSVLSGRYNEIFQNYSLLRGAKIMFFPSIFLYVDKWLLFALMKLEIEMKI